MPILTSKFGPAAKAIKAGGLAAMRRAASSHASIAQQLAPVDTGYLRGHIAVSESNEELKVVSGAPYSVFVEFGTVNADAQPFFIPAFGSALRQLKQEAPELIKGSLSGIVSGASKAFRESA